MEHNIEEEYTMRPWRQNKAATHVSYIVNIFSGPRG